MKMKIALIGYGKMGKIIEQVAIKRGHEISARLTSADCITPEALSSCDICIEFTNPTSAVENIRKIVACKKNVVVGTTGWFKDLEKVQDIVNNKNIGVLYSQNFSIGMYLLTKILDYSSKLINDFEEYDVAAIEYHHNEKKDPSGTGRKLAALLEQNIDRIDHLDVASVRCGNIPGTHTVLFDSPEDTISITHGARNREGFALGAVKAAEWLQGKQGLFTLEDMYQRKDA